MTPRWGPPRRSGSGWFRYRHATFAPFIYLMYQFHQDRLGTNTGKHSKQEWRFLRVDTARARQSAGRWLTCCQRVRAQNATAFARVSYASVSCLVFLVLSCLVLSCLVCVPAPVPVRTWFVEPLSSVANHKLKSSAGCLLSFVRAEITTFSATLFHLLANDPDPEVRNAPRLAPFIYTMYHFTKTGSGQSWRKQHSKKRWRVFVI
eukprot:COSAG06_NODE_6240_length_3020_cov_20.570055_1_plen_205_part_00